MSGGRGSGLGQEEVTRDELSRIKDRGTRKRSNAAEKEKIPLILYIPSEEVGLAFRFPSEAHDPDQNEGEEPNSAGDGNDRDFR